MKIVFAGRVTLPPLASYGKWDRPFPSVKWGFPLGSEIVKRLVAKGHEVFVVTEHTVDHTEKFVCDTQRGALQVWLVPSWKRSRWMFLTLFAKEMKGIRSAIREITPDVVFAQWTYHNAYAGLTSGFPTLVVAHDSPWRVFKMFRNLQTFIRALYATFFVVPKIKRLTSVSPYIVDEFRKFACLRDMDIPVIPNGIDTADCRVDNPNRGHVPTVVCVSQEGRLKNSRTLFAAWEILKVRHPDWRLLVYGQGMPQGMVSRAELDRVLREEADIFVSPTLEESFGMVFVEAMRFGVPCIGGEKSGAVPWVVGAGGGELKGGVEVEGVGREELKVGVEVEERGVTKNGDVSEMQGGVVCDVTDPKKLAECIERLMEDTELRSKLGEGGVRRVKEMFDIAKTVDMYERELRYGC